MRSAARPAKLSGVPVNLEDELDRLYGAELPEFVTERKRLAGALKKEGRRAEAEQVAELRKPSVSVWVVNQLARRRRKDIDRLLDAGHRLAATQRALLSGGERQAFERASKDEREALNRLAAGARSILGERSSTATLERVISTLRAAAISDGSRPDLARGRLTADVDPAGFDAFAGGATSAATPPRPKTRSARTDGNRAEREQAVRDHAAKRAAIDRAQAELRSAREREATLAKRIREAERAERAARNELGRAEHAVERARVDREAATRAVEAAHARLEEAER